MGAEGGERVFLVFCCVFWSVGSVGRLYGKNVGAKWAHACNMVQRQDPSEKDEGPDRAHVIPQSSTSV